MVCLKRPSYGMPPSDLARVIGKFSKREIKADTMIRPGMFTNKGHVRP
jgi:flagella basal body P-ring formation protein FlgA